ncbi:MAG: cell wall-binding repeat-containing protein, partial [Coriobacteriia bacterium]
RTPVTVNYRTSFCALSGGETVFAAPTTISSKPATSISGASRIETAIEASRLGFPEGSSYVVIATALSFPDALGGAGLAGALDAPILLTYQTTLPESVLAEIARLEATHVIVLGGEGAVSDDVYDALRALGVKAERIAGATRYATAAEIAERAISEMGSAWDGTAFVATGESFPDALGASPIAAAKGWPIYLLPPDETMHAALVSTMQQDGVTSALILGGTGVIPTTLEMKLNDAFADDRVERLAGEDRYTTALNIARYGVTVAELSWDRLAIATGVDFPDALAGGPLQGASGSVMLLAHPGGLHAEVYEELAARAATIEEVRFLGGIDVVTQTVRDEVGLAIQ